MKENNKKMPPFAIVGVLFSAVIAALFYGFFVGKQSDDETMQREDNTFNAELITIVINGNKHEFAVYCDNTSQGVAHWPNCRYCSGQFNNDYLPSDNPEGNPD